jgi:hypothetical protein
MITGYDSVFVVRAAVADAVAALLDAWQRAWPDLRVSATPDGRSAFQQWRSASRPLPADRADVLVACDEGMLAHWDEHGYDHRPDGLAPFAVLYQRASWSSLRVRCDEDPYQHGPYAAFEPYEATLLGDGFYLVTVVTPDDDSRFSRDVLSTVANRLTAL